MNERKTITKADQLRNSRRALIAQEDVVKLPKQEEEAIEPSERVYADSRIVAYTSEINLLEDKS